MAASPKKTPGAIKKETTALARTDDGHEMGLVRSQGKAINTHTHKSSDLLGLRSTQSCWI